MIHVFDNLEEDDSGYPPMCDMTFEIIEKAYDEAASAWRLSFRADASPGETVGFGATIAVAGWREQIHEAGDDAFHSFWGLASVHSRGAESDRLLALMADFYTVPHQPAPEQVLNGEVFYNKLEPLVAGWTFADHIECVAVGIASNPALIADEVIHMKLFFDDGVKEGRYAEVYLNIDLPEGFAALNEKDEDYRVDLIHWLSRAGTVSANPHGT